jgi:hypothetical protein
MKAGLLLEIRDTQKNLFEKLFVDRVNLVVVDDELSLLSPGERVGEVGDGDSRLSVLQAALQAASWRRPRHLRRCWARLAWGG